MDAMVDVRESLSRGGEKIGPPTVSVSFVSRRCSAFGATMPQPTAHCGGDQFAVRAFVRSRHSVRGKAFLEAGAYLSPVEPAQIAHGPDSLLLVIHDEARHAILNDLGHGPVAVGDHWRPTGHRLDHDEAERLRPIDRKQQGRRPGEKRLLLRFHLADKLDRPAIDVRLKLLLEVAVSPRGRPYPMTPQPRRATVCPSSRSPPFPPNPKPLLLSSCSRVCTENLSSGVVVMKSAQDGA
jgi:hypothetical protein